VTASTRTTSAVRVVRHRDGGQRRLTLDDAWRVCEALGMTLMDLVEGAPPEARQALGI
jgi:hypothetical protein